MDGIIPADYQDYMIIEDDMTTVNSENDDDVPMDEHDTHEAVDIETVVPDEESEEEVDKESEEEVEPYLN